MPAAPDSPGPESSQAARRAAAAAAEAADAARQATDAHRGPGVLLPYTRAGRLRRNARAAAQAAANADIAAAAEDLRGAALAAANAATRAANAATILTGGSGEAADAREHARQAAHAAHLITAAPNTTPRAHDTEAAVATAERTSEAAQAALRALDDLAPPPPAAPDAARPPERRRTWRPAVSARRLDLLVGSLIAVILTGTLVALVLSDATSRTAAAAAQTLAIAGIGFYFGAAVRRRAADETPEYQPAPELGLTGTHDPAEAREP